jgi:tripartite-type tricarboxylate transporter receptor subunit TctC
MWFTYQAFEPFVLTEKMRVIAVNGDERLASLPDIPTMKELGFKDFAPSGTWYGLLGPARLDPRIVKTLHDAFRAAMNDPPLMSSFRQQHTLPFLADDKVFAAFITDEISRYKSIVKAAGIVPQ